MEIPVLTAVTGASWESDLVASLDRTRGGLGIVRRCVDLADLLSAASVGTARAALVCPELRRLDRAAVARLGADGLAVVGLVDPGDDAGERRLRQIGVECVLPADSAVAAISAAVAGAVALARAPAPGARGPLESIGGPVLGSVADPAVGPAGAPAAAPADLPAGRLVAVWGPTGAPGRTTVAVTLADELAALGVGTLLADADTYGGAVAQVLGVLDEAPGLAAAARAANAGTLDVDALAALARALPGVPLRVLTGISRPDRWPELRPAALTVVWTLARSLAPVTVVDCGFGLEQDEALSFDTAAPQRNGATLATLEDADVVLAVGSADPVGLHRLVRGLADLRGLLAPAAEVRVVLTRVRRGAVGPDPERQVTEALARLAGVPTAVLVPADTAACDRARLAGRTLREVAPSSPARLALVRLAAELAAAPQGAGPPAGVVRAPRARRRLLGRRR